MAGIYLHIPFCRQACFYCDFHFSTYHSLIGPVLKAMTRELQLRKSYLGHGKIETVYLGGGTPSLLDVHHIDNLLNTISRFFTLSPDAEITLEANPDDLDPETLKDLKVAGINRLSIGVQSFQDDVLKRLNRIHTAGRALDAVENSRKAGIDNLNVDIIFAISGDHLPILKKDLNIIRSLHPPHVSTYQLTIEPKTVFGHRLRTGNLVPADEEECAAEYEFIMEFLTSGGYDHYEISNFSIPGYHSIHNTNYWRNKPYLGIGPSAHSYDLNTREYNISNNSLYINALNNGNIPGTTDYLTTADRINERILTGLRTKWGCNLDEIKDLFGKDLLEGHHKYIRTLVKTGMVKLENGTLTLENKGKLLADKISEELFIIQ